MFPGGEKEGVETQGWVAKSRGSAAGLPGGRTQLSARMARGITFTSVGLVDSPVIGHSSYAND